MQNIPFTYAIVRYVHDPVAGESLNIGIILYAAKARHIDMRVEQRYERLSTCFRDFNGDQYRLSMRALTDAVQRVKQTAHESTRCLPGTVRLPNDLVELAAEIWPDQDLSLRIGKPLFGFTNNLEKEIDLIFERMIQTQTPEKEKPERRSDLDVWKVYHSHLQIASPYLQARKFSTRNFELEFEHTYKNGLWHILQPVSMDFAKPESIQRKAATWLGNGVALRDNPEIGKVYLLLGEPHMKQHKKAYENAKYLLSKMPVEHEIVEESQAQSFAEDLVTAMRSHGVIPLSN